MAIPGVPLDKREILKALHLKEGIIEHAAKVLGCAPKTIYDWQKIDPEVAQTIIEARENRKRRLAALDEHLVNMAYESAEELIRDRDQALTIFTLKTKAKWEHKEDQANLPAETVQQFTNLMNQISGLQSDSNKESTSKSSEQKSA